MQAVATDKYIPSERCQVATSFHNWLRDLHTPQNSRWDPAGTDGTSSDIDLFLPIDRCVGVHEGPDYSSLTGIVVLEFAVRPGSGDHEVLERKYGFPI
jgi:hypothetical protein